MGEAVKDTRREGGQYCRYKVTEGKVYTKEGQARAVKHLPSIIRPKEGSGRQMNPIKS